MIIESDFESKIDIMKQLLQTFFHILTNKLKNLQKFLIYRIIQLSNKTKNTHSDMMWKIRWIWIYISNLNSDDALL